MSGGRRNIGGRRYECDWRKDIQDSFPETDQDQNQEGQEIGDYERQETGNQESFEEMTKTLAEAMKALKVMEKAAEEMRQHMVATQNMTQTVTDFAEMLSAHINRAIEFNEGETLGEEDMAPYTPPPEEVSTLKPRSSSITSIDVIEHEPENFPETDEVFEDEAPLEAQPAYPERIIYIAAPRPQPPPEEHKPMTLAEIRGASKEDLLAAKERIAAQLRYSRELKEYTDKAMADVARAADRDDEIRDMRMAMGIPIKL